MFARDVRRGVVAPLTACLLLAALSACQEYFNADLDDNFTPPLHYQRHPISVVKGEVRLELPLRRQELTAATREQVGRFGSAAQSQAPRSITISYPRGAAATARETAGLLIAAGIPPATVVFVSYAGRGPLTLSFTRIVAETVPCGDWDANLARTGENQPYPDFGCAQQQNIAAIVANPNDFVTPRSETPPDATRRSQILTDYRTPKDPSTPINHAQKATISKVGQ